MLDAAKTNWVIDVTDENFEQEVVERSKTTPVVIDFWAPWCGPCKTLTPVLEKATAAKGGAYVLAKVNIDEAQNLAQYFGIEGVPTVHAIRDSQFIQGFTGIPTEEQIKDFFDQVLPSAADNAVKEAGNLEAISPDEAEAVYRKTLETDSESESARLGLGRILVAKKQYAEALTVLEPISTYGDSGNETERLRKTCELHGGPAPVGDVPTLTAKIAKDQENARLRYDLGYALARQEKYPEALETLISAAELDKPLAKNEVRELMVTIFTIIGVRSEVSDEYRSRLQSLLY